MHQSKSVGFRTASFNSRDFSFERARVLFWGKVQSLLALSTLYFAFSMFGC